MDVEPTLAQREAAAKGCAFARERLVPVADAWDRDGQVPASLLPDLAAAGLLAALIPRAHGGAELDRVALGLVVEEVGRASASVASLLTVHSMASLVIGRWGSSAQRERWLPPMASGDVFGAFALSEPDVGSDAKHVKTEARPDAGGFVLTGRKKWITGARVAGLFVVIAQIDGDSAAFLVPASAEGLSVEPLEGLLGFRAAMIGEVVLDQCRVPAEALLGRRGFGFSHVVGTALDLGRYTVACSSVGLAQACLTASLAYTAARIQFGKPLREHQLVQQLLANMATDVEAARLLCHKAGQLQQLRDPRALMQTVMAKYFASQAAYRAATDAVQLHGANGIGNGHPVQRYLRDAKVMEIIEGTTQILQTVIARHGLNADGRVR